MVKNHEEAAGDEVKDGAVNELARMMNDESRPSKDPGDTTGDDEPTERSNDRVEGVRVEAVETAMSKVSRSVEEGPGKVVDEERRPGTPDEPSGELRVESRDPTGVQVEPGGETTVEPDGSVMHKRADAGANDRAEEVHGDVRVKVESARMRENASIEGAREWVAAHARSTTYVKEDNQRTPWDDEHSPKASPTPPEPPNRPVQHLVTKPPSVELKEGRRSDLSCDNELTRAGIEPATS